MLINSGHRIDPDVPSPGQFDHVITLIPRGADFIWLDTTPEVAPFGLLMPSLRDKEALVVSGASSKLVRSPANPPFRSSFGFVMNGKIGQDGTLDGKAELKVRGDLEVALRAAFRNTSQNQWADVAQALSQSLNFAGTVSDVNVSSPEATEDAFDFKYAYSRKNYPHWPDGVGLPLPPVNLAELPEEQTKISDPIRLEALGEYQLDAVIELPAGMIPRLRPAVDVKKDFAEYHAEYAVEANVLRAQRHLVIQMRDVPKSRSEEYRAFWKVVDDDGSTVLSLVSSSPSAAPASGSLSSNANAAGHIDLGDLLFYQKDLDGAVAQFRAALQLEPDNFRAHQTLGDVFSSKKDYDGALSEYREALRLNPKDLDAERGVASVLYNKGDFKGSVAAYQELVRLEPASSQAHQWLGDTLYRAMDYDEAIGEFREALRLDPKNLFAQRRMGDAFYSKREYDSAIAAYRAALQLAPDDAAAHQWLGNSFFQKRDWDGAIAELREALRLDPTNSQAHGQIADAMYLKRDFQGAIIEYQEAMRSNPNNSDIEKHAATQIAAAFVETKHFEEAIAELQPVVEKYPQEPVLSLALGRVQARAGQADAARTSFEKALKLQSSPMALNNVAYELADDNVLLDDAQRYGEQAVGKLADQTSEIEIGALKAADLGLMRALAAYWDTLGWVYFHQGRNADAERFLGAAWKLAQAGVMGDHLGQIYEKAGNKQEATHYDALTLALPGAPSGPSPIRDRLEALLGSRAKADQAIAAARGELGDSRTTKLPRVARGAAEAEFFVLFTPDKGATGVRFISGSEELRNAGDAIIAAHYDVAFPDDHPAKIVRRGILDCPATGTSCQFVLLPPESVGSVN